MNKRMVLEALNKTTRLSCGQYKNCGVGCAVECLAEAAGTSLADFDDVRLDVRSISLIYPDRVQKILDKFEISVDELMWLQRINDDFQGNDEDRLAHVVALVSMKAH